MMHTIVPEAKRLNFIPELVAQDLKALINFEAGVFSFMNRFTEDYNGGYWEFVTFENGAKAMILNDETIVSCENCDNYYEGEMSLRALSLACNLMVCSHMSFQTTGQTQENIGENYHLLRDVSFEHEWFKAEISDIWSLLD